MIKICTIPQFKIVFDKWVSFVGKFDKDSADKIGKIIFCQDFRVGQHLKKYILYPGYITNELSIFFLNCFHYTNLIEELKH